MTKSPVFRKGAPPSQNKTVQPTKQQLQAVIEVAKRLCQRIRTRSRAKP